MEPPDAAGFSKYVFKISGRQRFTLAYFNCPKIKRVLKPSHRHSAPSGGWMQARKQAQVRLLLQFSALLAALPNHPSLSLTARYLLAAPRQQDPDTRFLATAKLSSTARASFGPGLCLGSAGSCCIRRRGGIEPLERLLRPHSRSSWFYLGEQRRRTELFALSQTGFFIYLLLHIFFHQRLF